MSSAAGEALRRGQAPSQRGCSRPAWSNFLHEGPDPALRLAWEAVGFLYCLKSQPIPAGATKATRHRAGAAGSSANPRPAVHHFSANPLLRNKLTSSGSSKSTLFLLLDIPKYIKKKKKRKEEEETAPYLPEQPSTTDFDLSDSIFTQSTSFQAGRLSNDSKLNLCALLVFRSGYRVEQTNTASTLTLPFTVSPSGKKKKTTTLHPVRSIFGSSSRGKKNKYHNTSVSHKAAISFFFPVTANC